MGLTPDEVDLYHRQGWLAPIDILSALEASTALDMLEQAERDHPELLNSSKRNNSHLCFPFLADLALDERIVDVVSSIVGDDISLHNTVLFIKEPDSSAYVSWHQDGTYMGLAPHTFVTAWLALTESKRTTVVWPWSAVLIYLALSNTSIPTAKKTFLLAVKLSTMLMRQTRST